MAGHAIALDDHALLFAPGMMFVADVALAANTLPIIEIMRDQICRPLSGMHWLAADIADIFFGLALQGVGAWLMLIEGKMLDAVAMMTLRAATRSHFFAQMTGLFRVLLKHQGSPPDCVVWLRQSQRCAGVYHPGRQESTALDRCSDKRFGDAPERSPFIIEETFQARQQSRFRKVG